MAQTPEYSQMTKAQLTALARRKKVPVKPGALKEDLVKAIKKGLRKIEAQKKSKPSATSKTRKQATTSKTVKRKAKTSKTKTTTKSKKATKKAAPSKRAKTSPKKAVRKPSAPKKKAQKTAPRKPEASKVIRASKTTTRPQPAESVLPDSYGDHRLVVLARDPNWAYVYWDLDSKRVRGLTSGAKHARWVLRVYAAPLQAEEHKGAYFDVEINVNDGSYYLDLSRPGARFLVEIGVVDASGVFRATAQSNHVILPLNHPSQAAARQGPAGSKGSAIPGSSHSVPIPEALTSPRGTHFFKPPPSRSK